jgi:hypothetical protein
MFLCNLDVIQRSVWFSTKSSHLNLKPSKREQMHSR